MATDVNDFLSDLDGGVLEEKLSNILSDVASAVIDHSGAGEVILKLNMKQIASSCQIQVNHTLKYTRPTSKGKVTEDNTTSTPMYVGSKGKLTFFPEKQEELFDDTSNIATLRKEQH